MKDMVQIEQEVLASGGAPPPADAFTINGQPGPNYNCSANGNVLHSLLKLFTPRTVKNDKSCIINCHNCYSFHPN